MGHFKRMYQEGVEVDGVTFASLLSTCSHGRLMNEGLHYYESMNVVFNIFLTMEHYACGIDILSHSTCLTEAKDLVKTMPCEPTSVCGKLLEACRLHGNIEMAERVAKQVLELDPENATTYVLLLNIYDDAAGKWESNAYVKQEIKASNFPLSKIERENEKAALPLF